MLVDDPDDAAGRKRLRPKRILDELELGADRDYAPQPSFLILDRVADDQHPFFGSVRAEDLGERDTSPRQDLLEEFTVAGVGTIGGPRRCSDVGTVEGESPDIGDECRQFALDLPEQCVVRGDVGRIGRDRPAQAYQEIFEIADVVVELGGEQLRFD